MNKTKVFRTALLLITVVLMNSCKRERPSEGCKVCTATYNHYVIATQTTCTDAERDSFNTRYYYALIECK
jgi:hypothetical protein